MSNFYLTSSDQNLLGCMAPISQSIELSGFQGGTDYYVTWFPTRMNSTVLPDGYVDDSGSGTVILDLSTAPLGGTINNYLDTLHADYASSSLRSRS
jgi:hypothetical protein